MVCKPALFLFWSLLLYDAGLFHFLRRKLSVGIFGLQVYFLHWVGISCHIFSENLDVSACRFLLTMWLWPL